MKELTFYYFFSCVFFSLTNKISTFPAYKIQYRDTSAGWFGLFFLFFSSLPICFVVALLYYKWKLTNRNKNEVNEYQKAAEKEEEAEEEMRVFAHYLAPSSKPLNDHDIFGVLLARYTYTSINGNMFWSVCVFACDCKASVVLFLYRIALTAWI